MRNKTVTERGITWLTGLIAILLLTACFDARQTASGATTAFEQKKAALLNVTDGGLQVVIPVGHWIQEDGRIYFQRVYDINKQTEVEAAAVIDRPTFDWLYSYPEARRKVNNPYYLKNDTDVYYFKDKNHIYIAYPETPALVLVGSSSDYDVLGGAYLRVGANVYHNGQKIARADSPTFKTMNVSRNKSEWQKTIGLDKHAIYMGDGPITSDSDFRRIFDRQFYLISDSEIEQLRRIYFPAG